MFSSASLKRIGSISTETIWRNQFLDAQGQLGNFVVSGWIWPKFELIQAFMYVLVPLKHEKDPMKKADKLRRHSVPHFEFMVFFSNVQGQ